MRTFGLVAANAKVNVSLLWTYMLDEVEWKLKSAPNTISRRRLRVINSLISNSTFKDLVKASTDLFYLGGIVNREIR